MDVAQDDKFVKDVKFLGIPAFVYEFAPCGTLEDAIIARFYENDFFSEQQICLILMQIVQGILVLHGAGIGHLDVAPRNVFGVATFKYKLGDFGGAVFTTSTIDEKEMEFPAPGSARRPPEKKRDVQTSDAWGLGLTLLEMTTLSP